MIFNFHNFSEDLSADKYCLSPLKLETFIERLRENQLKIVSLKEYLKLKDCKLICVTFDDGRVSHYDLVLPILTHFNIKATFFIVTGFVGTKGYLNWEQITEIKDKGHEIGSHGVSHQSMRNMSQSDINQELQQSKKIIETKLGEVINYFAFPFGEVPRTKLSHQYSIYLSTQIEKNFFKNKPILGRINVKQSNSVSYLVKLAKMKFPEFQLISGISKLKTKQFK